MVLSLIGKALKGDVSAFKELFDSGYGMNKQSIDQNNNNTTITPEEFWKKVAGDE
jgi:hypothetical protein